MENIVKSKEFKELREEAERLKNLQSNDVYGELVRGMIDEIVYYYADRNKTTYNISEILSLIDCHFVFRKKSLLEKAKENQNQ